MGAMPWQQHIISKHPAILERQLQFCKITPTTIEPMHQQDTDSGLV
jgi:hypothetical protein